MSVDPRLALFLSSIVALISAAGATQLQSLGVPANHTEAVSAWLVIANGVLNAYLHAFSSTTPGPLSSDKK
jgi:hypothetical protein